MLRGNPGLENSPNTSPIPLRLTNGQLKFGGLVFGPLGPTGLWVGLVGGLAVAAVVLSARFWRLTRVV
jgi:Na+-driven multidrug efflux pump